jgi:homoserine dehydrogenase
MKIGLLGHGVVGSGVRKIIDRQLSEETKQLEIVKILVKSEAEMTDARMTLDADDILNDPSIDTVCECMGGLEPAHSFIKKALQEHKNAVTSNKKMLAAFAEELFALAQENHVQLKYEAACGGGIPWIHELEHIQRIDEIHYFKGIFNGTSNYILTRMNNENKEFGAMIKEAQGLGYAERDPSDDIDGWDVRYKTVLSSLAAFHTIVDPEEIPTFGIRNITKEEIAFCHEHGYVCKLIGSGADHDNFVSIFVRPCFVKKEDVFASIPLNYNALECDSDTLGKAVFIGQGAGSLPTAHAVVQDLIDTAQKEHADMHAPEHKPVSAGDEQGIFYLRTKKTALFNPSLIDHRIGSDAFVTKRISFMDMRVAAESLNDESVFLAEVAE